MADIVKQATSLGFSPGIAELLRYLRDQGVVKSLKVMPDAPKPFASYNPDEKEVTVWLHPSQDPSTTLAHELVHAVQFSGKKPNSKSAMDLYNRLGLIDQLTTVLPKHWTKAKMDSSLTRMEDGVPKTELAGSSGNKLERLQAATARRRFKAVADRVPPGQRWSGIYPRREKQYYWQAPQHEGEAYYFTEPRMVERKERAKELGMMLLDHDVPMPIVEGVVRDLTGAN